jgi:hypothetical protein
MVGWYSYLIVRVGDGGGNRTRSCVHHHTVTGGCEPPTLPVSHPVSVPYRFWAHQEPSLHALESRETALAVIAPHVGERER